MVVYALLCLAVIAYFIYKFDKADKRYDTEKESTSTNIKINAQPISLENDEFEQKVQRGFELLNNLVEYIVKSANHTVEKMPYIYRSSNNVILGQLIILSYMIIIKQCCLYSQYDTTKLQEIFIERVHHAATTTLVLDTPDKIDRFMKMIIELYIKVPSDKDTVDVTAMAERFLLYTQTSQL